MREGKVRGFVMYRERSMPNYYELERRKKSFEDITKLIEKSLRIKSREFSPLQCILEFENPKTAISFALNFENYFPMDDKLIRINYDLSYVYGIRSLAGYADYLKNRRIVYLIDIDRVPYMPTSFGFPGSVEQKGVAIKNHIKEITASAVEKGTNPKELIVCYTSGWGGEDLYGALGGFSLKDKGYIVFPEAILDYFVGLDGVPDLIAVKLGAFQDRLIEEGVIEYGAWLPELELQRIFDKCMRKGKTEKEEALAVEVEPSKPRASSGHKQLNAYVSTGHFDLGALVCPGRADDKKYCPEYGYITWDNENKEVSYFPEKSHRKEEKLNELLVAAKKLVSLALIKNWTTEKLLKVYGNKSIVNTIEAFVKTPTY